MRVILESSGILNLRRVPGSLFDENYIRALRDCDPATEEHLVAYFSRPVQIKLQSRLRSPELVKDAIQETFLRVLTYFRTGKTLDNPAALPGFVYSVSNNVGLELLRSSTRHDQLPENAPEPSDPSDNPESQMAASERREIVRRLLQELTPKDRDLLRRVLLEEEDKDAVCREFRVDRGYLRVLLHRARLRFKAALLQSERRMGAPGK
ncbi:MAG: sigma-70 family RNA polymerase sigma factor [Acidobacteriia bacterium]|nr:sigma-70 family RNA polymerase sigma factor [Terriglobia bacterium]